MTALYSVRRASGNAKTFFNNNQYMTNFGIHLHVVVFINFTGFYFSSQNTFEKRKNKIIQAQFQGSFTNTAKHGKYCTLVHCTIR